MHWLIQDNIGSQREAEYDRTIQSFERMGVDHTIVSVVPFSHELIPEVSLTGKDVTVIGTTLFTKIAKERGWTVWRNENFDSRVWLEHYKEELLNHDALTCKFGESPDGDLDALYFIRPVYDHKVFTGCVVSLEEWKAWADGTSDMQMRHVDLNKDTLVSYATTKKIYREYRFFIVNGKVITGSLYRRGRDMVWEECKETDVIEYCQRMTNLWQPDKVFVMDIAYVDDNAFKIIELNCANSAGMYRCDMQKFIDAVEEMNRND